MLDLSTMFSLAIAMALFGASPGPGIFAVVGRALSAGFASAMLLTLGLILGDLVWLTLATSGLSVVADMMGEFFIALKIVGGLYLAWMGIKAWRAPVEDVDLNAPTVKPRAWETLVGGLTVTLSNPKAILFYMAILPTVLDLSTITAEGLVAASVVVVLVLILVCAGYAFLASRARRFLQSKRAMQRVNRVSGALLVGVGAWVASR